MGSEEELTNVGGGRGRGEYRNQSPDTHLVEDDLHREQYAADWRIECRGDSTPGSGCDQGDPLPDRHAQYWATVEPKEAPICMMGPSRPTEPPLPIEREDASALTAATTGRMIPLWW